MNWVAIFIAGVVYFALGGIWFSPQVFGRLWDQAIGFERPDRWKPSAIFYIGPLIGCLVASVATALLIGFIQPNTLLGAVSLGLVVGIGYGGTITGVNAISPTASRPGLFTAIVGSYHVIGLVICTAILYVWP